MITVVGMVGACLGPEQRAAIAGADLVVGGRRLLDDAGVAGTPLDDVAAAVDAVADAHAAGAAACVLASGDPGFFGIVRRLAARCGPGALRVLPAASSVAVAFARLGIPWDDATVVSAHGRPLADAARLVARAPKAAVLTAPDARPEALGAALLALGAGHEHVAVCERLGSPGESVSVVDLRGLAAGQWDPLAVVALWHGDGVAAAPSPAWGLPEDRFAHRAGMITRSEVRSVALGLLELPGPAPGPVLWDVGAGSGAVAVEAAAVAPWLEVVAIERDADAAQRILANARSHGVAVRVVADAAPGCLGPLPDPDRVFVGGGGTDVLQAAWSRLRPGGVAVATFAALDRAAAAASLLGNLVEVSANRGRRLPDGGWRLEGANPVFVAWGRAA